MRNQLHLAAVQDEAGLESMPNVMRMRPSCFPDQLWSFRAVSSWASVPSPRASAARRAAFPSDKRPPQVHRGIDRGHIVCTVARPRFAAPGYSFGAERGAAGRPGPAARRQALRTSVAGRPGSRRDSGHRAAAGRPEQPAASEPAAGSGSGRRRRRRREQAPPVLRHAAHQAVRRRVGLLPGNRVGRLGCRDGVDR